MRAIDQNKRIGSLGGDWGPISGGGMWGKGPRGGTTGYHYGYPAYGPLEPNVVAQWLFDEASGNIVDEVNSITLTQVGTPTYGVTATGLFLGLSPGILFDATGDRFENYNSQPPLAHGTNDFMHELWFKTTAINDNFYAYSTYDSTVPGGGYILFRFGQTPNDIQLLYYFSDATFMGSIPDVDLTTMDDGGIHKARVTWDRDGNVTLYVDGINEGSGSIAASSAKSVAAEGMFINTQQGGGSGARAGSTLFEIRVSQNITNNSGGPGGG